MHQIFYIDIDEEITSVIDRLKNSKTTENFFVVSPRSLILQSVVSLKLLKREAAKDKKQIAIVVNDKEAGMKIEKAGILVVSSLKGIEGGEEIRENFSAKMEIKDNNKNKNNVMEKEENGKKARLQKIGTDDFYDGEDEKGDVASGKIADKSDQISSGSEKTGYPENSSENSSQSEKLNLRNTSDVKSGKTVFSYAPEKNFEESLPKAEPVREYGPNRINSMENMDPYKEKLVEGFFNPGMKKADAASANVQKKENCENGTPVSHGMRKVIFGFVAVCIILAAFIAAYVLVPKAKITVATRDEVKKFDVEAKADSRQSEVKANELTIPGKIIEKEISVSSSFKSTGSKSSSSDVSQKAKGKIIIYNEFGPDSQQLVATTRFVSTDGKLFRLVKAAVVPGMSGGKSGSVEADVIADQPGEEYNIEASSFKIPGFEGSPKYEKFFAKSLSSMTGGGSSGGSSGQAIISQSDLDKAKKESEEKVKDQLEDEVKKEIGREGVLLSDSSEKSILESTSSSRVNEAASSFEYSSKGKIKAIIFSENDLRNLIGETYNKANKEKTIADYSSIEINYGASSADFNSGLVSIKANVEVPIDYDVNWTDFKKKMLGKNDEEIKEILKEYPQIEKVDIDFWPNFLSRRIPQYEKRVEIKIEKSSN